MYVVNIYVCILTLPAFLAKCTFPVLYRDHQQDKEQDSHDDNNESYEAKGGKNVSVEIVWGSQV